MEVAVESITATMRATNNCHTTNNFHQNAPFLQKIGASGNDTTNDRFVGIRNLSTVVELVLIVLTLTVALVGNTCLCFVVISDEKLRSVPNKLVLNLAFSGLFTVLANGPFLLVTVVADGWIFSDILCQINGFTTSTYGLSCVLTLAVISLNRYQMIKRTMRRTPMLFTDARIPFLIGGVWVFSALLSLPPIIGWSKYSFIAVRAICTLQWSTDLSYTAFMFTFGIFAPFAVIFIAYICIFTMVRKNFKRMREHTRKSSFRNHNKRNHQNRSKDQKRVQDDKVASAEGSPESTPVQSAHDVTSVDIEVDTSPYRTKDLTDLMPSYSGSYKAAMNFLVNPIYTVQHGAELNSNRNRVTSYWYVSSVGDFEANVPDSGNYTFNYDGMEENMQSVDDIDPQTMCSVFRELNPKPSFYNISATIDNFGLTNQHNYNNINSEEILKNANNISCTGVSNSDQHKKAGGNNGFQTKFATPAFLKSTILLPKDDLRLTVMVFVVLASFMLCWAPITIINFVETVLSQQVSRILNIIAVYMMFLSAAINPIIYGLMNRNSRRAFYRMFCGWTCNWRLWRKSTTSRNKVADVLEKKNGRCIR